MQKAKSAPHELGRLTIPFTPPNTQPWRPRPAGLRWRVTADICPPTFHRGHLHSMPIPKSLQWIDKQPIHRSACAIVVRRPSRRMLNDLTMRCPFPDRASHAKQSLDYWSARIPRHGGVTKPAHFCGLRLNSAKPIHGNLRTIL
jgi:hypothetical protein